MKLNIKNITIGTVLVVAILFGFNSINKNDMLNISTTHSINPSFVRTLEMSLKGDSEEFSQNGVVVVKNGKIVNKEAAINFAMDDDVYSLSYDEAVAAINALEAQYGSASSASNTTTAPAEEEQAESSSTTST